MDFHGKDAEKPGAKERAESSGVLQQGGERLMGYFLCLSSRAGDSFKVRLPSSQDLTCLNLAAYARLPTFPKSTFQTFPFISYNYCNQTP